MKREDFQKMKVEDLKSLIRKHNLHTSCIKGYSRMKKAELAAALVQHYPKRKAAAPPTESKGKKSKASKRPKKDTVTEKLVPGINKPLYKKGVAIGAREQFEKKYGKQGDPPQMRSRRGEVDLSNVVSGKRQRKKRIRI